MWKDLWVNENDKPNKKLIQTVEQIIEKKIKLQENVQTIQPDQMIYI